MGLLSRAAVVVFLRTVRLLSKICSRLEANLLESARYNGASIPEILVAYRGSQGHATWLLLRLQTPDHKSLSPREKDVVYLRGQGLSVEAVAKRLKVSKSRVHACVNKSYLKLSKHSLSAFVFEMLATHDPITAEPPTPLSTAPQDDLTNSGPTS